MAKSSFLDEPVRRYILEHSLREPEILRELREHCRRELGPYKTPKLFRFVAELPRGPSGKVQRLKLLDRLSDADAAGAGKA